ncbi:MAG: sulfur carrier protein ThiS, partial [Methanomassiliicoccaceae archaeon]|nr:sulfur carrier protein ThiS [Methanomassiliicoccaceae archaeon]
MHVNGHPVPIHNGMRLSEFLIEKGYDELRVAVEKNGEIVRRKDFGTEILSDDDRLEIVCFVGGG